jgi:hypothetical protein
MHVALVDIHIRIREMAFEVLKTVPVAEFIAKKIEQGQLSVADVAAKAGWDKPVVLENIIAGRMKVPINQVAPLADAIGVDPANLLRLVMQEYMPETYRAIVQILDCDVLSAFERDALDAVRYVSRNGEHAICISPSERVVMVGAPSEGASGAGSPPNRASSRTFTGPANHE